jgi:hypothetical protein
MGEAALVVGQLSDAEALVKELDMRGMVPSLVAWYYYDDAREWRLVVAGRSFDELLPKQETVAYGKLVEAMATLSPTSLTLSDVKLVRTDTALAQAIGILISTPPDGVVRAHFSNTLLNGIFISEMVILRSA